MKLKYTEIKSYRLEQLSQQGNLCALCQETIIDDAVLDHDHKTGKIRRVLHRGCNSMLGKIENNMPRSKINLDRLRNFTQNLISYIELEHTDILHPKHKEKAMPGRGKGRGKKPPKR